MPQDSSLNIADIESVIQQYRSFFDSSQEINEQIFHQKKLTSAQDQFLKTLTELDSCAKLNRNPDKNEEVSLKINGYIESLEQIEEEIRLEQEKRLASNSSSQMSRLFHHDDSFSPEGPLEKFLQSKKQADFEDHPDSSLTDEEIHLKANYMINHEKIANLNSNAALLFSIFQSLFNKGNCPDFIKKHQSQEKDESQGSFFEAFVKDESLKSERSVKIVRLKEGGYAIFAQNHDRVFEEVEIEQVSDKLFTKILKEIYVSSNIRTSVLGENLYKIQNGFYIDQTGKIITYNQDHESLCVTSPSSLSTNDYQIIEGEVNLESIYDLLTDENYIKSTQSIKLQDGSELIFPKSYDGSRDRFAMVNNNGLIQIYQRNKGQSFSIAKNSKRAIEFAKKLESDIKDTLIFDAVASSLKGKWGLLNKISPDPRITKESIVSHIQDYLHSSQEDPFDINFLAKMAFNVESIGYHVSKLVIKNRIHFLPQIIYGHLDPSPYSTSFVVKIFSRYPNFLDHDEESEEFDENIHNHNVQESLGFITHSIINAQDFDFDQKGFASQEDFFTAYTNCLSRFSRQIMDSDYKKSQGLSEVIYKSFSRLINSLDGNNQLILPLITKILGSFNNKPNLSILVHKNMIEALVNSKIDRNSKDYRAVIVKICSSLIKVGDISEESLKIFDHLIDSCSHDENLANLVRISVNQLIASQDPDQDKFAIFEIFPVSKRLGALASLDFYPDNIAHRPDLTSSQISSLTPRYLTYDEVQSFTRLSRKELNLLPVNIAISHDRSKIAKQIRATENKYQHTKPDLINLTQTFVDYDRAITKTIITDHDGNVLYRMGDSIHDYITAPIRYFFANDPEMLNFLLSEVKDLDVSALDHGLNLDCPQDIKSLQRLKPRLRAAIEKVVNYVDEYRPNHPYLTFLKGFNQSSEGEMLFDTQSFVEDKFPGQFICNSSNETVTVVLSPSSVTYKSNCNIEISKRDFGQTSTLANLQATGLVTIDYANNSKIANDSFLHSFENSNLDVKTGDSIQRFVALNANSHQFDDVFYDMITNPIIASGLSSLFADEKSDYHKITINDREEQIYIPRNNESGFVFTVIRNQDRTISNIILHEGLYEYYAQDDDYHPFSNSSGLSPANFKELSSTLENVTKLCRSVNKNTKPLRDAFCELKTTKFNKKSQIGEIRSVRHYKFKFRSIGKLKSGKKLYLDENGRLLVNVSLTSVKLVPISHPQPHVVEKLPVQEISSSFDLSFSAQHFDHQRKPFHRFATTFKVKVRKIGIYKDVNNKISTIYQDAKGRRFKSIANSGNLQEIFDINLESQNSSHIQSIIDQFKERSSIHEIFDEKKPRALITQSNEVNIGPIQHLSSSKNSQTRTQVREITVKPTVKSPQKSFHIDRFGVIYTKDKQNRLQKHDLQDLDQNSRDIVLKSLELSGDNLRLQKIYKLLEKNNSHEKIQVNLKPYDAKEAHVFVKNGVKYALFQDSFKDHHLMRLTYEKGVKNSKTGVIHDLDSIKLITSNLERKAIYDDLQVGTYLVKGSSDLKITQEEYFGLTIKSFTLSGIDSKIAKNSPQDQIIAIDSNLRILHKKPGEENYHVANYSKATSLMPHFYECISQSVVKLDNWKAHYTDLMAQRQKQEQELIDSKDKEGEDKEKPAQNRDLTKQDLHTNNKTAIKTSTKTPSTTISDISIEQLHESHLDPLEKTHH